MKNFTVLSINEFDSEDKITGFYSNTIENHIISAHKNIYKPHKHNFYLTVLFTQGSGIHEIDFVSHHIKPGSLFFLNPGQMHYWELSEDIRGFIFFHTQEFYDLHFTTRKIINYPFFNSIQNSSALYLDLEIINHFETLFYEILNEFKTKKVYKTPKILTLIELIYIESTRLYISEKILNTKKSNTYAVKFQEFERLVEKHYDNEKAASQYADWLHISSKHLNRITKNMVNKTTTEIILERVILEAKRELIFQKFNFNEIATKLGYVDYAHFSRLFKKKCGETPSEFLKRYKTK